jgi:hypothetical protein
VSCTSAQIAPTSPTTPNANRSRIDVAYTSIAALDLHRVSSRTLLTAALSAVREQAIATGGTVDPAAIEFADVSDEVIGDFKVFIQAVEAIARRNPQLSADLISDTAIGAMVDATPDCHTFYRRTTGDLPSAVAFQARLLSGSVGYISWKAFRRDSTFNVVTEARKAMDVLLAQGARSWLFDWRDSPGGQSADEIANWFLNGEPLYQRVSRAGFPATTSGRVAQRLPAAYQLPIAIVMNRRSGSSPEVVAMSLKENHRATIVGTKTPGCVGTNTSAPLPGGGSVNIASEEFVGAISGIRYARIGVEPDVVSEDAAAVDVAVKLLLAKVGP